MKTKYQVKSGDQWITCTKAVEVNNGFLHYNLKDGTNGLARPGTWRIKPSADSEIKSLTGADGKTYLY